MSDDLTGSKPPISTLRVQLPFPLLGLPEEGDTQELVLNWPIEVAPGRCETRATSTTLAFRLLPHEQAPLMAAAGWQQHGSGKAVYSGDTHGSFALTEVEVSIAGIVPNPMSWQQGLIHLLVGLLNSYIDFHAAHRLQFWTPRLTPRDLVSVSFSATADAESALYEGSLLTFGNMGPLVEPITSLFGGTAKSAYALVRDRHTQLWAATFLDAIKEFLAARSVRGATLSALAFELFLNAELDTLGVEATRATLSTKGQDLLGPHIGAGLNSLTEHGAFADVWCLVLQGRNTLLHRQEAEFEWRTSRGQERKSDMADHVQAGGFIVDALRLAEYVRGRLQC